MKYFITILIFSSLCFSKDLSLENTFKYKKLSDKFQFYLSQENLYVPKITEECKSTQRGRSQKCTKDLNFEINLEQIEKLIDEVEDSTLLEKDGFLNTQLGQDYTKAKKLTKINTDLDQCSQNSESNITDNTNRVMANIIKDNINEEACKQKVLNDNSYEILDNEKINMSLIQEINDVQKYNNIKTNLSSKIISESIKTKMEFEKKFGQVSQFDEDDYKRILNEVCTGKIKKAYSSSRGTKYRLVDGNICSKKQKEKYKDHIKKVGEVLNKKKSRKKETKLIEDKTVSVNKLTRANNGQSKKNTRTSKSYGYAHTLEVLQNDEVESFESENLSANLNQKIDQLNSVLEQYEFEKAFYNAEWSEKTKNLSHRRKQRQETYKYNNLKHIKKRVYENFKSTLLEIQKDGAGELFQTERIQEFLKLDSHDLDDIKDFPKIEPIDSYIAAQARNEALNRNMQQIRKTIKIENSETDDENQNLKRLVRSNPYMVSKLLFENPNYTNDICGLYMEIGKDRDDEEFWNKAFLYTSIAVLPVALFSGTGAALVPVLLGTLALTTSEAVYFSKRSHNTKDIYNAKLNSYLSNLGDDQSIDDINKSLQKFHYERTRSNFATAASLVNLGFTGLVVTKTSALSQTKQFISTTVEKGINKIKPGHSLRKALQTDELDDVEYFLRNSIGNHVFDDLIKSVGKLPVEEQNKFLNVLYANRESNQIWDEITAFLSSFEDTQNLVPIINGINIIRNRTLFTLNKSDLDHIANYPKEAREELYQVFEDISSAKSNKRIVEIQAKIKAIDKKYGIASYDRLSEGIERALLNRNFTHNFHPTIQASFPYDKEVLRQALKNHPNLFVEIEKLMDSALTPNSVKRIIMRTAQNPDIEFIHLSDELRQSINLSDQADAFILYNRSGSNVKIGFSQDHKSLNDNVFNQTVNLEKYVDPKKSHSIVVKDLPKNAKPEEIQRAVTNMIHEMGHGRLDLFITQNIEKLHAKFPKFITKSDDGNYVINSQFNDFLQERYTLQTENDVFWSLFTTPRGLAQSPKGHHTVHLRENPEAFQEYANVTAANYQITDNRVLDLASRSISNILIDGELPKLSSTARELLRNAREYANTLHVTHKAQTLKNIDSLERAFLEGKVIRVTNSEEEAIAAQIQKIEGEWTSTSNRIEVTLNDGSRIDLDAIINSNIEILADSYNDISIVRTALSPEENQAVDFIKNQISQRAYLVGNSNDPNIQNVEGLIHRVFLDETTGKVMFSVGRNNFPLSSLSSFNIRNTNDLKLIVLQNRFAQTNNAELIRHMQNINLRSGKVRIQNRSGETFEGNLYNIFYDENDRLIARVGFQGPEVYLDEITHLDIL